MLHLLWIFAITSITTSIYSNFYHSQQGNELTLYFTMIKYVNLPTPRNSTHLTTVNPPHSTPVMKN